VAQHSGGSVDFVRLADARRHASAIVLVWMAFRGQLQASSTGSLLPGVDTLAGFVALMLASVFFLGGIYLAMRFIHRRPLLTLITPARSLAWGDCSRGLESGLD